MKTMKTKGFTLVEIMIVVAIIGIIIAIAVPAFLRARENARGRACQENLTKIEGAKEQYALEFKKGNTDTVAMGALIKPPLNDGTGTVKAGQGYLKNTPECPSGGTYTEGALNTDPICSYNTGIDPAFVPHELPNTPPAETGTGA